MATRHDYVTDFLAAGGYPTTDDNVRAVLAWIRSEFGGASPLPAAFNGMATTQDAPGASDFNSVGVKNYPDWPTGIRANVDTLAQDHGGYQSIRDHLHAAQDASATCQAISASAWGSHPSDGILAEVVNDPANNADAYAGERTGDVPTPAPAPTEVGRVDMPMIAQGSTGDAVVALQRLVGADPDGQFGPLTYAAVQAFQSTHGLTVDGIVGPQTWAGLAQSRVGATVDGIYGPETTHAVGVFQLFHKLTVDGIAGPQTFAALAAGG